VNTIEYIKMTFAASRSWTMGLIEDMRETPLTQPTSSGGNHPLWVLGHIVVAEAGIFDGFILGERSRFAELNKLFGAGTQPTTNADDYPSMDELLGNFEEIRAAILSYVDTLTEEDLEKPSHAPEKFGPKFATIGACLIALTLHPVFHAGQVADARRVLGKPSMSL
jgi:hypothetical protein